MVYGDAALRGEKKPGQDSQSLFIKPKSGRKSISVACNYSHADSVEKKALFFIYHQGRGKAEVDSQVHGAIQLFLTEAQQHGDTFKLYALKCRFRNLHTQSLHCLEEDRNISSL